MVKLFLSRFYLYETNCDLHETLEAAIICSMCKKQERV